MATAPDSAGSSGSAAVLVAQALAAHQAGRGDEAAALLEQARPTAGREQGFWELDAALALAAGAPARAVAALERACALARERHGRTPAALYLNLALACFVAGRADDSLAARNAAEQTMLRRLENREAAMPGDQEQLDDVDVRLTRLLWEGGRYNEAIAAAVRALGGRGDGAARGRLGQMLAWRGRTTEALLVMLARVLHAPDEIAGARDIAVLLDALGAHAAARAWYRRARALNPEDAAVNAALARPEQADAIGGRDVLVGRIARPLEGLASGPRDPVWPVALGRALADARAHPPSGAKLVDWDLLVREAATAAMRRTLALRPGQAEPTAELARLLLERPALEEGLETLRAALKLAPTDAGLHLLLGQALRRDRDVEGAIQSFRVALALQPDMPGALTGLADALLAQGPDAEVLALLDRAVALDPSLPLIHLYGQRALALAALQRPIEAQAEWERYLTIRADDFDGHFGRGVALLLQGRLEEAWPEYAWRWYRPNNADLAFAPAEPLVRPDPAAWAGRTVLLYAEQAQGDTIQFLRYARMVAAAGARVVLEVQGSLKTLAAGIPDLDAVIGRGEARPAHDIAIPLLHLPWAFGTSLATIPAIVPYLRPDLTRAAQFRRRMQGLPGLKVGLVWSGEPRVFSQVQASMDRRRSLSLAALAPLARVPGVVFVSLQKGPAAVQAASPPAGMVLHDWTGELADFADTAALMTALDLVISVDTAPAHLAGALGRPVWLLNRFDTDFRWLLGRDDSPWYPTMRQFRQVRPGEWDEVVERLAAALHEKAGALREKAG